jgi:hypothetical protein
VYSGQNVQQGRMAIGGRFRDTNGDGLAEESSIFNDFSTVALPNALSTNGMVAGAPYYPDLAPVDAKTLCHQRDAMFVAADYRVVNGVTNTVQWQSEDGNLVGSSFVGTAEALAAIPSGVEYSFASVKRDLTYSTMKVQAG